MGRYLRKSIQVVLFLLMIGASVMLWSGRAQVVALFDESANATGPSDRNSRRREERAVPVITSRVGKRSDTLTVLALGTARAKRAVSIIPEVAGKIVALEVASSDFVNEGQTLLKLDDRKAQIALDIAENQLAEAKRALARAKQLNRRDVASIANVEDAKLLAERAELQRDQAQELLKDHVISAPFAGLVGISAVEPGDRVTTTTTVMTLDDRSSLLVEFDVPERFISRLSAGLPVEGLTPGFEDRTFKGRLSRIDSRVDVVSRTITVRAEFDNAGDNLRPGMSFEVTLTLAGDEYPTVPELAVQWRNGESYLWRVALDRVRKVPVRVVRRTNGLVLVDGNLAEGDLVVVEGVQRLREGRAVSFGKSAPHFQTPTAATARQDAALVR